MVEWAVTDDGVVARGSAGQVTVGVDGWRPRPPEVPLGVPVDAAVAGAVGELRLPGQVAGTDQPLDAPSTVTGDGADPLAVDTDPGVALAFEGRAELAGDPAAPTLAFGDDRVVSLGFVADEPPPATVTVPPTPSGLATYVSAASAALRTTGPDRSHPVFRAHPPRLELGEEHVPERVAAARPDTCLELVVPDDLAHVLVAAPLGYYLGATLSVGEGPPALHGDGPIRTFDRLPEFQHEVASLLRRVFGLDAAVRPTAGASDPPVARSVGDESPTDRLLRYLEVPRESISTPSWPLSTYVDPTPDRARCLPYLLDRLSLVYLAESTPMDGQELLQRSLDDFFRDPGEAPSVAPVDPVLGAGEAHAWLADGTPIDAFTTGATAHENRRAASGTGAPLTVDLVLNDEEMVGEGSVAEVYRDGVAGTPVEVTVRERLSTSALGRTFEDSGDLVHYVGHCEVDGLVCPDGTLAAASLGDVGTRTVFLNACGSVHEGRELVRAGASAAAVTLTAVLDDQAATVGTAFARLLGAGLAFERAMQFARGSVMTGKDYAVVGDGTVAVAPAYGHPAVLVVEPEGETLEVEYRVTSPRVAGRRYRDPFDGRRLLYGTVARTTMTPAELRALCRERSVPVVLDGEVRASDDVASELA